ncbi:DUF2059 domain-containing protein [Cellulophaga sp. HaHaR_3_176]|uniref:DUF2059 domain-containing protein n=1 Tax=Cellulophaga sp. HaHaR_3_176 TaxID=1942464 RepID=UPI001C1FB9F7|nr:DUF2059 domain-containing protein [Cellulophaga sp. HaHaR_3_176]QWX84327.1 DUF2059 domain-containing protein [Cellulophaga sp. HaHaR_3_176]
MMSINKIVAIFFMVTITSCAQEKTYNEDVISYLNSNGTSSQYEFAYDELLKMLEDKFPKTKENSKSWEFLDNNKEKYVAEMTSSLVPVYQKNFTEEELKKMADFYRSPTGKQLTADRSKMTEDQKNKLNDFYKSEIGKKIIDKQPVLSKDIAVVSENWSRDLYETALSLLK